MKLTDNCPVEATLDLIGGKYKALILWHLSEKKLRFSYKEEREFATIDEELAKLEEQIAQCQTAQESCGSDYVKLQELQAQQEELEAKLEEKTERWVYLNELKEKIDAQ